LDNELHSVVEITGSHCYSHNSPGNPTGETLENTASRTRVFDAADRCTSVTNKNSSGTTLSII